MRRGSQNTRPKGKTSLALNFMKVKHQKDTFLQQFQACGGDMKIACEALGVSSEVVRGWVIRDQGFRDRLGPVEEMFEAIAQGRIRGMVPRALDAYQGLVEGGGGAKAQEKVATRVLENEGILREMGGPGVVVDNRTQILDLKEFSLEELREMLGGARLKEG